MDGRDLVRSVKAVSSGGPAQGLRVARASWRRRRADAVGLSRRGPELARVPGSLVGVESGPGGGVVRFGRSRLRITVMASGAVFWGWDGAEPTPSYGVVDRCPEADPRAVLEPDKDGGWRVVSERATVAVSRHGAVTVCTPGGVLLRRDLPPRWWEPVGGGEARWVQRSEVTADARFFGLGGRVAGPRLRDGTYALWNAERGGASGPGGDVASLAMPVQVVVADAGTHLVFQDNTWDGAVSLREGREGAGSGHDRPGTCEVRMEGGPLRCWVVVGAPARVLHTWAQLTGAATVPPSWALGHHLECRGGEEVRRVVAGCKERSLPLEAVHVDGDRRVPRRVAGVGPEGSSSGVRFAEELRGDGVRWVSVVDPVVRAEIGDAVFDDGQAIDAFVRDASGRLVRGAAGPGETVYPDFTSKGVRKWWGGLYEERLARGVSGFRHGLGVPLPFAASGGRGSPLPRSARHALEGRGGDHREAHNVYGLCMARSAFEALSELQPRERPFLLSGAGWVGMQRYGGAWSGDVGAGWSGLREALSLVIGLGLCGVPYSGSDVGGPADDPSGELYVRWLQLGAYLPLLRTRSGAGADRREPWDLADEMVEHARVALNERRRLLPYFMTLAHLARRTGAPLVRPLWWGAPEERALRDCEDAFLLGDSLLVAPVLEPGARRRSVRLPPGRWYDTVTGAVFDGPGTVSVEAPLSRIPVLARAGCVVPVRGGEGGTEWEVWAPEEGRTGGGVVVPDVGDGWQEPEVERWRVRWSEGRVVVEREGERGSVQPPRPVRVRGL